MCNWFQVTPLVRENSTNTKITEAENQSTRDDKDKLSKIITLVTTRRVLNPRPIRCSALVNIAASLGPGCRHLQWERHWSPTHGGGVSNQGNGQTPRPTPR